MIFSTSCIGRLYGGNGKVIDACAFYSTNDVIQHLLFDDYEVVHNEIIYKITLKESIRKKLISDLENKSKLPDIVKLKT